MKSLFREYLRLGRGERSAFLILLTLICLLLVARYYLRTRADRVDYAGVLEMVKDIRIADLRVKKAQVKDNPENQIAPTPFDPNTATQPELESQGIPGYIAARIVKFRNAGGHFHSPEDLLTVYGFSEKQLLELRPFIRIENTEVSDRKSYTAYPEIKEKKKVLVSLNHADSATFTTLPGIGPAYSARIIKYRNLLGGFIRKEQIMEVYGFTPELYEKIESFIVLDSAAVSQLNINLLSKEELAAHPYFSYSLARNIVLYREQHGLFSKPEDLRQIFSISDSVYQRIRPYVITQ